MRRSFEMAVDAALAAWVAVAVAQHAATVAAVLPWFAGLPARPDLRAGYTILGLLLLAGAIARGLSRAAQGEPRR